ncbi:MAG: hypothetical protein WAM30_20030, partial [Candidatus Dormiibacterota bacterium]
AQSGAQPAARWPSTKPAPARPASAPIRLPRWIWISAAVIAALLVVSFGGNAIATSQTSPTAVATSYVQAVGNNDLNGIWDSFDQASVNGYSAQFGRSEPPAGVVILSTKGDLASMLRRQVNRHPPRSDVHVLSSQVSGDRAQVTVAYTEEGRGGTQTVNLALDGAQHRLLLYPHWGVVPALSLFQIAPPDATSRITLDGVAVPSNLTLVQTFPGGHEMSLAASRLFKAATDSFSLLPGAQRAQQFELRLTSAAQQQVVAGIHAAFAACVQSSDPSPGNCPQSVGASFSNDTVQWTQIGDAATNLDLWQTGQGSVGVVGRYLMTATIADGSQTAHRFDSGAYYAEFSPQTGTLTLTAFQHAGTDGPTAKRPAAGTDAAVRSAVGAGFQQCAAVTLAYGIDDCPQRYGDPGQTATWSVNGDPTSGSTVLWNNGGFWIVQGNASMTDTPSGGDRGPTTWQGAYQALVIWNGSQPDCIYIQPTY